MTEHNNPAGTAPTLPLDQVSITCEFYGVKLAELGEDSDAGIAAFTHDKRRALAAINRYVRETCKAKAEWIDAGPPEWWQIIENCGCGEKCPHVVDEDGDIEHDCPHYGLPPCTEEALGWIGLKCPAAALGAVPVIECEASY